MKKSAAVRCRASTSRFQAAAAWLALSGGLAGTLLLSACAMRGPAAATTGERYRCEQGLSFTVRFVDDSALVDSSNGNDVLFRDAGGTTPLQTVFSNTRVRAEFGLGDSAREAVLRYPLLPLAVRCVRD